MSPQLMNTVIPCNTDETLLAFDINGEMSRLQDKEGDAGKSLPHVLLDIA